MKKHDFLHELLQRLASLPEAERQKAYAFYAEIIDDSMEDGMSEDEAVAKLGAMGDIVDRIMAEIPVPANVMAQPRRKRNGMPAILLLVLGFPVWVPLLATTFAVVLTLFIVLWVLALVLWAVFASVGAAALGGIAGLFFMPELGERMMLVGGALACAGLAVWLFPAALGVTKGFARGTGSLWRKTKARLKQKWRKRNATQ